MKWLTRIGGVILLLTLPTYSYLDLADSARPAFQSGDQAALLSSGQGSGSQLPSAQGVGEGREEKLDPDSAFRRAAQVRQRPEPGGGFVPEGVVPQHARRALVASRDSGSTAYPARLLREESLFDLPGKQVEIRSLEDHDQLLALEVEYAQLDRPVFGSSGNPFAVSAGGDPTAAEDGPGDDSAAPVGGQASREDAPAEEPGAANEGPGTGEESPSQPDPADGPGETDSLDHSNGDEGNQADPPPAEEPPPPEDPPPPEEPSAPRQESTPFDFLISRAPSAAGEPYTMRAKRGQDGLFLMENEEVFALSQFQLLRSVSVSNDAQMVFTDIDGDGLSDLLLGRNDEEGAQVHIFFRHDGGESPFDQPEGSILLPGETITSLALFDFDDDGLLDVAAVLEDRPSLLILSLQPDGLKVVGDLVLNFRPGLVIDWRGEHPLVAERRLYIYDPELNRSAVITSFQPDVVREFTVESGRVPAPLSTRVNWHPNESTSRDQEILIFEARYRSIILGPKPSGALQLYVNLDLSGERPIGVVGDFLSKGGRSTIVVF
ncbi:MAG TPA: FG-GAP-like repeat-containing protein [Acidobacteriota bacterium]|nr:FG-GAP-like repeat-containing protein [Acidobacteriota bacterium]